jgi:hypothetical protein
MRPFGRLRAVAITASLVGAYLTMPAAPAQAGAPPTRDVGEVRVLEPQSGPDETAPVSVVLDGPVTGYVSVDWTVGAGTSEPDDLELSSDSGATAAARKSTAAPGPTCEMAPFSCRALSPSRAPPVAPAP